LEAIVTFEKSRPLAEERDKTVHPFFRIVEEITSEG
jgi:hypothetical protein